MKVAGIIAEYNPFHNGHAFHIEETRKRTGADYVIAVMSGDFVQRGAPAILNKYERARAALENGVDLVIELPTCAAISSAEGFATGAVSILGGLGVVDVLSFGAEISSDDASAKTETEMLTCAARLFAFEPSAFRELLSSYLKKGHPFASARAMAATKYLSSCIDLTYTNEEWSRLLSTPNNILAIEYIKAILRCGYTMTTCPISRTGAGYHDCSMDETYASATAIRRLLLSGDDMADQNLSHADSEKITKHTDCNQIVNHATFDQIEKQVPASVLRQLMHASGNHLFVQEDDFSDMLFFALHEHSKELLAFGSPNPDFSLRVQKSLEQFESWTQFASLLKTKNQTHTGISRYLSHVMLGLDRAKAELAGEFCYAPYARILGFQKSAAPLLKEIREKSSIPILMHLAKDQTLLSDGQKTLLDLDIHAADLYNYIRFVKSGQKTLSDYRQPLSYI
jgi:predicted nucleotidyltransferase